MTPPLLTLMELRDYLLNQAVGGRALSTLARWSRDTKHGHGLRDCVVQRRPKLFSTHKINTLFIPNLLKANAAYTGHFSIRQAATGVYEIPKKRKASL